MSARLARAGLIAAAAGAAVLMLRGPIGDHAAGDPLETPLAASAPASAAIPVAAASAAAELAAVAPAASGASAAASAPVVAAAVPASAASAPAPVAAAASAAASAAIAAAAPASGASAAALAALAARQAVKPCGELIARLPNVSQALCEAAELKASGWMSVEGFPLFQRDVAAPAQSVAVVSTGGPRPPRRPRVLVIGAIHGDEISSASLVFHWIAHAIETGAEMDWRFIPALNPDGLLQKKPSRMNARGIDLNRNFPTPHWHPNAHEYWIKRTKQDARRYPGPEPLSEPESRFVTHTMDSWKPDVIVSVHAPFGVLDYDGPSTPPERLGRLFLDRVGIYPGSLGNYGGAHRGIPVVTIELPSAVSTPTDADMRQMWIDLLRWIGERLSPVER
ncbi:M14 family zinc carboxypeptidase [Piscinibacter sakaiensis]|uniref:M14 family zinc carboxypeptidase n=1 Tax=Piscinibacter sakaiensis TaxID=1547922 RepID=UPI003AAAA8F6